MTSGAPLTLKSAALLALATAAPAFGENGTPHMTPAVVLICSGGAEAPICQALSAALSDMSKDMPVSLFDTADADVPQAATTVRFVKDLNRPDAISGHLEWETADGSAGRGPQLELSVMDAAPNRHILNSYATQLTELSNIPL